MGDVISIRTARAIRAADTSAHAVERAVVTEQLMRVRRGAYLPRGELVGMTPESLHLARIAAARAAAREEPVFSHVSAAALHRIPILGEWPDRVCVTVGERGTHSNGAVERIKRDIPSDDIVALADGTRTTSLARTAVDLALRRSLLGGIVALSHVRHAGVSLDELEEVVARAGRVPGLRRARTAMARSSDLVESVLETLVLVRCQDYCFEPAEVQREVVGDDGRPYRVDFAWDDGRVLLEADGKGKYERRAAEQGITVAEAHWREKQREDALRPACDHFLRTSWADAWAGDRLRARLDAAGVPRSRRCAAVLTF